VDLAAAHPGPGTSRVGAAHDIVQDTWVAAFAGLHRLRDPGTFPAWIYGIATRKCVDVIRQRIRRRRLDALAPLTPAPPPHPTGHIVIDVTDAISRLPPIHRAAVHMFYMEGFTIDEIAGVLQVPAGTVKSRLHHARDLLRRDLEGAATSVSPTPSRGETHE
jgi:RNA polymerase sigma factor (sigma-70 family)